MTRHCRSTCNSASRSWPRLGAASYAVGSSCPACARSPQNSGLIRIRSIERMRSSSAMAWSLQNAAEARLSRISEERKKLDGCYRSPGVLSRTRDRLAMKGRRLSARCAITCNVSGNKGARNEFVCGSGDRRFRDLVGASPHGKARLLALGPHRMNGDRHRTHHGVSHLEIDQRLSCLVGACMSDEPGRFR